MRPPRIDEPGTYHHVMNRGRNKQAVFRRNGDYGLFLDQLAKASALYGLEVHAYALMTNHYHLLVRSVDGRLSDAMQSLGSCYTQSFHARYTTDGALFKGRFLSKAIDSPGYLIEAFRYVVNNPVKARLVDRAEDYRFSSYVYTLGLQPAPRFLEPLSIANEYFQGDIAALDAFVSRAGTARALLFEHAVERRTSEQSLHASLDEVSRVVDRFMRCVSNSQVDDNYALRLSNFTASAFSVMTHELIDPKTAEHRSARIFLVSQLYSGAAMSQSALAEAFALAPISIRRILAQGRQRVLQDPGWRALAADSLRLERHAA